MKKGVSPRVLLGIGLSIVACSLWLMGGFDLQADFPSIALPRIIQRFGLGLFFVPLSAATYVNIPKERMGNASGVFNLLRNLGGAFRSHSKRDAPLPAFPTAPELPCGKHHPFQPCFQGVCLPPLPSASRPRSIPAELPTPAGGDLPAGASAGGHARIQRCFLDLCMDDRPHGAPHHFHENPKGAFSPASEGRPLKSRKEE
jgi:hypothetical protein